MTLGTTRLPAGALAVTLLLSAVRIGIAGGPDAPALLPPGQRPRPPASARVADQNVIPAATPAAQAAQAAAAEDHGEYADARELLRELRGRVAPDADLELALALDEARSGQIDSSRARLWGPLLSRAVEDTLDPTRFHDYPFEREKLWTTGRFEGWAWIVARARAEVAMSLGRWAEALIAAGQCSALRPLAGKELLLEAVAAANTGDLRRSQAAAEDAVRLDPTLPEAFYLRGLFSWRAGRREAARRDMRAAMALDSLFREPAIALTRLLLPASAPDPFPRFFLAPARAAGMLTSATGPKIEERVVPDVLVMLFGIPQPSIPDSLRRGFTKPLHIALPTLVGADGRALLHELPWFSRGSIPDEVIPLMLAELPGWRFRPASRLNRPIPVWTWVEIEIPAGANP